VPTIFIDRLLIWVADPTEAYYLGWMYWLAFWGPNFVGSFLLTHSNIISIRVGTRIRSALMAAVYRKSLNLSTNAKQQTTTGEVVNLVSNDSQRLLETFMFINWGVFAPFQIAGAIIYLYFVIGWYAFIGLGIMVGAMPFIGFLANGMQQARVRMITHTDERVKLVNELINAIRIVKMYAWEACLMEGIRQTRGREMVDAKSLSYYRAWMVFGMSITPTLVATATFITYGSLENTVSASEIFTALSLFNMLRVPLALLPFVISMLTQNQVSMNRIRHYLLLEEGLPEHTPDLHMDGVAIQVNDASFAWGARQTSDEANAGSEATQSAALKKQHKVDKQRRKTLQKEQRKSQRHLHDDDAAATTTTQKLGDLELQVVDSVERQAEQDPATENVASASGFHLDHIDLRIRSGRTYAVIGSVGCGKSTLIQSLLGLTRLVEGQMLLSGSLAYVPQEAWIRNASVRENILFGSPYDAQRYREVIDACALTRDLEILPAGDQTEIGERGINLSGGQKQRISIARAVYSNRDIYLMDDPLSAVDVHVGQHIFDEVIRGHLKDKTVLFATNQVQFLPYVDSIVLLANGGIAEAGTYDELMADGLEFRKLMDHLGVSSDKESPDKQNQKSAQDSGPSDGGDGALIGIEERDEGEVSWTLLRRYWLAGFGLFMFLFVVCIALFKTGVKIGGSYWLAYWADATDATDRVLFYTLIYAAFGAAEAVLMGLFSVLIVIFGVNASISLHERLLHAVTFSPVRFFDVTPSGRILNRFAKDMDVIDMLLPGQCQNVVDAYLQVLATLVIIAIVQYYNLIGIVPLCVIYYILQKLYRHTSREIQRIESVTRSPVYAHLSETLNGLSTIRAYQKQEEFMAENHGKIDLNTQAWYSLQSANQWLAMRLEWLGAAVICVTVMTVILLRDEFRNDPGLIGLAISHALGMTVTLNWASKSTAEAETKLNAVERVLEYSDQEMEPAYEIEDTKPVDSWPDEGIVQFDNVVMSYRPELKPALRGVSFTSKSCEKIGIVGRTGSGKSSLMIALFRLTELTSGTISVDGIDISTLGLKDLRSRLSIIPQEPIMFAGTIRRNLDPFQLVDDDEVLWRTLALVDMHRVVGDLPEKLEAPVAENGDNFSLGQRQLICLARCLIKRPRILVCDEASASVDGATDLLIQKTIREQFKDCTILTVAHRLTTIMDSDRILVVDEGNAVEFDSPAALLERDGLFSSLVNGSPNASFLRGIATGERNVLEALEVELVAAEDPDLVSVVHASDSDSDDSDSGSVAVL